MHQQTSKPQIALIGVGAAAQPIVEMICTIIHPSAFWLDSVIIDRKDASGARDLKPDDIQVARGRVKILDFGASAR